MLTLSCSLLISAQGRLLLPFHLLFGWSHVTSPAPGLWAKVMCEPKYVIIGVMTHHSFSSAVRSWDILDDRDSNNLGARGRTTWSRESPPIDPLIWDTHQQEITYCVELLRFWRSLWSQHNLFWKIQFRCACIILLFSIIYFTWPSSLHLIRGWPGNLKCAN